MAKTPGLGVTLPVQRGNVGFFNTAFDPMVQTKSNLTNLLLTKKGERLMQPTFGSDLHKILFEEITDDTVANVKGAIQQAAQVWLPFVSINDVQVQKDEVENAIFVQITFSLKTSLGITDTITLVL